MKADKLIKGKKYRYTGGCEPIEVIYLYEIINGYLFELNGVKNPLSTISVKLFIEEIPHTAKLRCDQPK